MADPNNIQDLNRELSILEDSLTSISVLLKGKIEEAFENIGGVTERIADVYAKNLERSIRGMAKNSDSILKNTLGVLSGQNKSKDIAKQLLNLEMQKLAQARNIQMLKDNGLVDDARLISLQADLNEQYETQNQLLKKQLDFSNEINKKVGLTGKFLASSSKIPFLGKILEGGEALTKMNIAAANGASKVGILGAGLKGVGAGISKSLLDPVTLFMFFMTKALKANAEAVELGKALGIQGEYYRETLSKIELSSGNINVTTENLVKAFGQLSASTGLAYKYTTDQLSTQIKLTEQVGLQAEDAAQINKFAIVNNKTSEETYRSFVKGLTTARNQLKVGINFKTALTEAAKVSGELAVNLGYNPETIAKAVVQMKALGTSLEQTKSQGDFLLNWETSIESELKSELLIGQQMNLERARAAALTGDQITLAKELSNQGMTLQKFENLNVIARRSYAEALGLNVDQLSNQLQLQKQALDSGKSFAQVTEEEARTALERQNAQDKFNKGIEKLTSLIGNLLAGPLGVMLDVVSDIAGGIDKIISGLTKLMGSTAVKLLLGTLVGAGIGVATGGLGWIPALIGAGSGLGLSGASAAMGDDVVSPGYGQRMILHPEGAVALNNNDTVIAGTNLNNKQSINNNIDLTPMIAAINSVKTSIDKLYSKDTNLYMDGKQIGTTLTQGSYKLA